MSYDRSKCIEIHRLITNSFVSSASWPSRSLTLCLPILFLYDRRVKVSFKIITYLVSSVLLLQMMLNSWRRGWRLTQPWNVWSSWMTSPSCLHSRTCKYCLFWPCLLNHNIQPIWKIYITDGIDQGVGRSLCWARTAGRTPDLNSVLSGGKKVCRTCSNIHNFIIWSFYAEVKHLTPCILSFYTNYSSRTLGLDLNICSTLSEGSTTLSSSFCFKNPLGSRRILGLWLTLRELRGSEDCYDVRHWF